MKARMNPQRIVIDGKTYASVDEMPPDVRQKYEEAMRALKDAGGNLIPNAFENMNLLADKDRDGMPDILEGLASTSVVSSAMKIVVDGKEYDRVEDLPPDARARYEQAMGKLDANRNGVPDFMEGMMGASKPAINVATSFGTEAPRRSSLPPVSPTITPETSNGWMLAFAGLLLVILCIAGAAGVWYFFFR